MTRPTETAEPTDRAVVARSRDEPEIFALLFRRHAPQLQRYIGRRLGPDAAEDVLAEVFLAAFRQRHRYDPGRGDARPWLYGIATNLIGRHRRAEVRALRALERTGVDPVTEPFVERSDARVGAAAVHRRLADAATFRYLGERAFVVDADTAKAPVGSQVAGTAELSVTVADGAPEVADPGPKGPAC